MLRIHVTRTRLYTTQEKQAYRPHDVTDSAVAVASDARTNILKRTDGNTYRSVNGPRTPLPAASRCRSAAARRHADGSGAYTCNNRN